MKCRHSILRFALAVALMFSPSAFGQPACFSKTTAVDVGPMLVFRMRDGTQPTLQLTLLPCTSKPVLLSLGPLTAAGYPVRLRVLVTKPEHLLLDFTTTPVPQDHLPPTLVPVPAGSKGYTIRIPLDKYRIVDGFETLDNLVPYRSRLSMQAEVLDGVCAGEPPPKLLSNECRLGIAQSRFPVTDTQFEPPVEYPWLHSGLEQLRSLKPGMSRSQFAAHFHDDGVSSSGRFPHRSFPFIKMDAEFSSSNSPYEGRREQISKLSQPFVEFKFLE